MSETTLLNPNPAPILLDAGPGTPARVTDASTPPIDPFMAEVQADHQNERRLLSRELLVLFSIVLFVAIRASIL